jgi:hypothetical protein
MTAEEQQQKQFQDMFGLISILGGILPKHLSLTCSRNISKIIGYDLVEKSTFSYQVEYITGETFEKLAGKVNAFLESTPNSSLDGNPFPSKSGYVQTVEIVTETPTGEFVAILVFDGGETLELTEEQNKVFRRVWNQYAEMANTLFNLAAQMYAPAQAAAANPTGEANQ